MISLPRFGFHAPGYDCLTTLGYLDVLNYYSLHAAGSDLLQSRKASWYTCIMRAAAFESRAISTVVTEKS